MHRVLLRQLKKLGIEDTAQLPSASQWQQFLERINQTYDQSDQDRYTLERSLDISSKEMQKLYEAAESANHTKSDFLANMSHELRSPMNSIMGFIRRVAKKTEENTDLDTNFRTQQLKFLGIALSSSERLLTLLNDILDLSKLEAQMMQFNIEQGDLLEVVKEGAMEQASPREEKSISLTIEPPSTDTHAYFDHTRIMQVILNLLSNATKFTPEEKHITITFADSQLCTGRRRTDTNTIPALSVTVRDEGPGIPPGELELVFDKFAQSSKNKSEHGGTGLGLAISREIVSAHLGTLHANNHPKGGAAFILTLPRSPVKNLQT